MFVYRGSTVSVLLLATPDFSAQVPAEVSHSLFWQRYFYRVCQLRQDEERRADLKKRAETVQQQDIGWEDGE